MSGHVLAVHYDIIYVHHANLALQPGEYFLHKPLERGWSSTQAKEHDFELVESPFGDK